MAGQSGDRHRRQRPLLGIQRGQAQLLAGERTAYLDDWGDSAFDPVGHFEAKWHSYVPRPALRPRQLYELQQPAGRRTDQGWRDHSRCAERQTIYDEAQQIVYDEAPAVFLILPEEAEAARADITNWEPASDSRINLHDVCIAP